MKKYKMDQNGETKFMLSTPIYLGQDFDDRNDEVMMIVYNKMSRMFSFLNI